MIEQEESRKSLGAGVLLKLISVYRKAVSPLLGQNCRYYPSCSSYTYEAIEIHGAVKGSWLGVKRIGRCHPFRDGGFDPVPGSNEVPSDNGNREMQGSMS